MERPIADIMSVTLQKIKEMVDVNTIIGDTITTQDGTTIIPVSKLAMGFGTGGSEFGSKTPGNFGGGGGAGINITPVAFLIVSNGNVKMLPVSPPAGTTVDRMVERVPEIVDKIADMFSSKGKNEENENSFASNVEETDEQ